MHQKPHADPRVLAMASEKKQPNDVARARDIKKQINDFAGERARPLESVSNAGLPCHIQDPVHVLVHSKGSLSGPSATGKKLVQAEPGDFASTSRKQYSDIQNEERGGSETQTIDWNNEHG